MLQMLNPLSVPGRISRFLALLGYPVIYLMVHSCSPSQRMWALKSRMFTELIISTFSEMLFITSSFPQVFLLKFTLDNCILIIVSIIIILFFLILTFSISLSPFVSFSLSLSICLSVSMLLYFTSR